MITLRKSEDRGRADFGWLDSYHTFSFGDYYDPQHMGFRSLRVINDDRVAPGKGFGMHPHNNMEIITYVIEGSLEHKDSMGTGSVIRSGDVQRMSAGTGIAHSEFNPSAKDPVHLLQIWIVPDKRGLPPEYEQKAYPETERQGHLRIVASRDGRDGSLRVHQDARLFASLLDPGQQVVHELLPGRHAWVQVARGAVTLNGQSLGEGDGAAASGEKAVTLVGVEPAEVLVFDLA